jgi:hypothetical protein
MLLHTDFDETKLRAGKSGRRGDCSEEQWVQYIDEMEKINLEVSL